MKQPYLAVYDYQTGGLWTFIYAHSPEDIKNRYPVLKLIDPPPAWMNESEIARTATFDIDEEPPEWLTLAMKK